MISQRRSGASLETDGRLLQLMLTSGEGGAETFFEKLAIAFQEAGIPQRIVICRHAERRARLEAAGCEVTEIAAKGIWKWTCKHTVSRIAKAYAPNIQFAWMSRAAGALSRRRHCTNVARLGGYYPLKYYRNCHWLIGNTPGVIQYLENEGWPPQKMRLISNFGETPDAPSSTESETLRQGLALPEGARIVLTLGRLHRNKAQDVLIRAMSSIPNAILLIGGEGSLGSSLENLARRIGVTERVRFLGWRRDTEALFRLADICVFPSRAEPLGNVVLEAWAHGVPIASAASEGPSWLIEHGRSGLLFPVDDVDGCAAAANRLLNDAELARRCVENGRLRWQLCFSKDAIVSQYKEFFGNLIDQRSIRS